ncbi:hypothetical protein EG68_07815 [Paragonimus skrjabini miyazakii]|uniref:Uncharacterized protein n=1 Tax=Paragonimus skrjabini miyazakii TaxID=59628 RepID=A0A8S9Y8J9_9TREM|nr:hypothetical protein EG68_07815 [Paragonimus skrjabini miyazakii]
MLNYCCKWIDIGCIRIGSVGFSSLFCRTLQSDNHDFIAVGLVSVCRRAKCFKQMVLSHVVTTSPSVKFQFNHFSFRC